MNDRKHDIEKYLKGELSAAEMHALEKEALHDPFLAEALEGVEHAGGADNFLHDLHKLNQSVHQRSHRRKNKSLQIWGWTTAAAATLLLVVISGFMVINLLREQRREQQAQRAEEKLLLEMTSSRDTLTVVLPPRIAYHETETEPRASLDRPTASQRREAGRARQSAPDYAQGDRQRLAEIADVPDETADTPEHVRENSSSAEREAIALADTPETESSDQEIKEVEKEEVKISSKKTDSRAAAGEVRSGAALPSQPKAETARAIRGRVTSSTDGDGLPGVNVLVKGSGVGAVTDQDGNFEIAVSEANPTLVFSFIGFEPRQVNTTGEQELNVSLEEDAASLSEVVVTAFGAEDSPNTSGPYRSAEPSGGKSAFSDYLSNAIRYPTEALRNKTEGRVTVRFIVEPDGRLTNFEVVRGIGSGCDEELIRAIQQGPSWQPGRNGELLLREKVKVRFVFRLP